MITISRRYEYLIGGLGEELCRGWEDTDKIEKEESFGRRMLTLLDIGIDTSFGPPSSWWYY